MSNPYDDEGNPFADAAVIEAAENENDYEDSQPKKKGDKERLFAGPSSSSPPSYNEADDSVRRKEEELKRKERELQEKQRQLDQQHHQQQQMNQQQQQQMNQQQQQMNQQQQQGPKQPNWPICKPFIYHNILDEIPPEWQKTVRNLYYSWFLTIACLGVNLIGCMCILIAGISATDFGVSIMYFFVISVCAFFLWYRPVYNAFMKDTSFYFLMFLVFGGCHVIFEAYMLIGIPDSGSAGIVNMSFLFAKGYIGEGVICLISTIFWIILFLFNLYLYRIVYLVYKARGHSVAAARNQAISSGVQTAVHSEAGREAMASAVSTAATSYIQGGSGQRGNMA